MRHVWVSGGKRLEILTLQVDDGGYDLVLPKLSGFSKKNPTRSAADCGM
jgi:hypothetical protein